MAEAVLERKKRKTKVKQPRKKESYEEKIVKHDVEEKKVTAVEDRVQGETSTPKQSDIKPKKNVTETQTVKTSSEVNKQGTDLGTVQELDNEQAPVLENYDKLTDNNRSDDTECKLADMPSDRTTYAEPEEVKDKKPVEELLGVLNLDITEDDNVQVSSQQVVIQETMDVHREEETGQKMYPDLTNEIADLLASLKKAEEEAQCKPSKSETSQLSVYEEATTDFPDTEQGQLEVIESNSSVYATPDEIVTPVSAEPDQTETENSQSKPAGEDEVETTIPSIETVEVISQSETAHTPVIEKSANGETPKQAVLVVEDVAPLFGKILEQSSLPEATAPPSEETPAAAPQVTVKGLEKQKQHQALTLEQLNSLYYNSQLAENPAFIERFVQHEMKREGHEFYEILMNYQRARRNLLQCEAAIDVLEKSYLSQQEDVWIMTKDAVSVKGTCGDGAKCTTVHSYEQSQLNEGALLGLKSSLESTQDQIQNQYSLHSYSDQLSKLQVESYVHNLLMTSPALRDLSQSSPVHGHERLNSDVGHQVSRVKDCITILFGFHRIPINDEVLVKHLQGWTRRLVSVLLRVGTLEDHLFILNHVIRCPAGVGTWAAQLVQVPAIPTNQDQGHHVFGNIYLDHLMTCMATLLIPAIGREEFLCQMRKCFTPVDGEIKDIAWIMVDSDGEEDEDPQQAWLYLHENDIVAILQQLSLADIFKHIFFIEESQFTAAYDIERTGETTMYRVFAFCTCLVRVLGCGLHTYNMSRYRQLNKRLGRMIRQTVQYVSDHWETFAKHYHGVISPENLQKLQAEFDAFFMRAVNSIHMSQRLGSWQFIADMPFSNISKGTMWQLLWLLHQNHGESFDLALVPTVEDCRAFVRDGSSRGQLADILQQVPGNEGIYLLNAMTNMTDCCTPADADIVHAVTMAIFEVGYLCPDTRELWSKMVRELLASVVLSHPFMLSLLTQKVQEDIDKLGVMALYLYKGLPLAAWLPGDPDLVIVRQWLQVTHLGHPTNQLAQVILRNINWGKTHKGDSLMVPWRVHKQVAVLVVEAYQKFILGKNLGSAIMEGVRQMTAVVHQQSTNDQEFHSWCWDLLLKLSLHRSCLPKDDQRLVAASGDPPDLHKDDTLLPLVKGIKENNPAACCVTLMLTNYGHNASAFVSEGLPLLQKMADQGLFKPILCVLNYTLPLFTGHHQGLMENDRFISILQLILTADESYFKVAKGFLSYEFPGPITKLFICMFQNLISDAAKQSIHCVSDMLCLLAKLILKIPKWYQDRNCCCVLDFIVEAGFRYQHALPSVQQVLQEEYQTCQKAYCTQAKQQGVVSSIMNWVTSGVTLPSFIEKWSFPEFSWLAYILLHFEGQVEKQTRLWSAVQEELLTNQKMSPDAAVKKCITHLKLEQAPTFSRLNIYRWSQQALDMPECHPAAVLVWHRFFVLYLGRLESPASLPQRASVGEKFFNSSSYFSVLKKMKKKLGQIVDYHMKQSTATSPTATSPTATSPTATSSTDTEQQDVDRNNVDRSEAQKQLHCKIARMFQTFQMWLEEPRLHDANLYLPSLPPQYESDRLLSIFQNQTAPWFEFLDMKTVEDELVAMVTEWKTTSTPEQNPRAPETPETADKNKISAENRILTRLKRQEVPLSPPDVQPLVAPVPEISTSIIDEKAAILHLLKSDLIRLKEFSEKFFSRMAQHKSLDHIYLEFVPKLFRNVEKQGTVSLHCTSMINPLHRCSAPGSGTYKVEEAYADPIIHRQAEENRAEFRQIMIASRLPPPKPIVICVVHMENAITMLVKLFRSSTDQARCRRLNEIACNLFFYLGKIINQSVLHYPPTKQFFTSCLDILGQEFVQNDGAETEKVLKMALDYPELAGLMSPHFNPGVSPRMFVAMYERLMKTLQGGNPGLTFTMLTKFDLRTWLTDYKPHLSEVQHFINVLLEALMSCGVEPDDQHQLVFEIYIRQEKILLSHNFPCYLSPVLAALVQGSASQKLKIDCWKILNRQCFYGNQNEEQTTLGSEVNQVKCVHTDLSTEQVRDLLHYLGQQMLQTRTSQKEAMTFGLYSRWKLYVPEISQYLQNLSICLVDKMMPSLTETQSNEVLESVWHQIVEAFAPWIQALYPPGAGGASMPWIEADKEYATHMIRAFRQVVTFAHFRTEGVRGRYYNDFMSLLWLYFASVLCKSDVTSDVVAVYNLEFSQLPWQQIIPNMAVMETMSQVKEFGSGLGFNLVSDIMALIDWTRVIQISEMYYNTQQQARFQGCLYLLLIQAFAEGKHLENPDIERLLTQAEVYKWNHLTAESFRTACAWFLQGCDPKCLLAGRTSTNFIGLRILKSASGFNVESSAVWTEDISVRRLNYLHCVCQLVCQCTYLTDCDTDSLSTVLINLLTEIETVENAVIDVSKQQEETAAMLKEVLSLLNNCNPEDKSLSIVMTAIVSWLQDSPHSTLLVPCVKMATRCLASLSHMIKIVEECIQLYFISERQDPKDPWGLLLANIQIPELNVTSFFSLCLQDGGYLVLYCYVLQQVPFCQRSKEQHRLVEMILEWTSQVRPSADQESCLLLWWYTMVDLLLKELDFGGPPVNCIILINKIILHLNTLGEERASGGLLGAIGLGKKSLLSDKFRLCCRAIAAFCSSHVINECQLRFSPSDPPSTRNKQEVSSLLGLRNNKRYQPIKSEIENVCDFVQDQSKCLGNTLDLISLLAKSLYADKPYLTTITK